MIEFEINTNKKQIDFEVTQGIPKYVPANFQSKTVVPTTEQQIVRADKPYDGLEQVTVEPIKVLDKTITENGTYNAESDNLNGYSSVEVNVQPNLQEKSITITENGTTEVVADYGYDGLARVSIETNVKDNSLLNVIKGMNSYDTSNYPFELTADMFDENSTQIYHDHYFKNKNLTKVTIPSNITRIGGFAFMSCTNLTSVTILGSIKDIEQSAFDTCINLTSIKMGSGVISISNNVFYANKKLLIVDFRERTLSNIPTIQSTSFYAVPTTCKFIIPDELYDSWITATNWASLYASGYQFIKASEYTEA